MIDLIGYAAELAKDYGIMDPEFRRNMSLFLVSNNWFGYRPVVEGTKILLAEDEIAQVADKLETYCAYYYSSHEEKTDYILEKMAAVMPKTAEYIKEYAESVKLEAVTALCLSDFLMAYLPGELHQSTDVEIGELLNLGFDALSKLNSDVLAEFINWVSVHKKTIYKNRYSMKKYIDRSNESSAYDPDSYLSLIYHLFNSEYIEKNDMYYRAAESRNYVDTWLYLALHLICALRNTDLVRIPHPSLLDAPRTTLDQIKEGTFPPENARMTISSVLWKLDAMALKPNKTKRTSGVADIKFHVPESVEVHMGTLFAAAQAHFMIAGLSADEPLIRVISMYEDITRYMGDEIGELFLESNFRSKAASKSYMQMAYILTDDILGYNDQFKVKGYMIAALARSHKGAYGDFAKSTSIYLRDAKMSGYTPEFVAKELFERGVLSMIPSMLLKMIAGEDFENLSIKNQTKAIKNLGLSPQEVEVSVSVMQKNINKSIRIVKDLYLSNSREEIVNILHRIGNGEAAAKTDRCMCIVTAEGKACPYQGRTNCIGCGYEICTKTTMLLILKEIQRLKAAYAAAPNGFEKEKIKAMISEVIIPAMEGIFMAAEEAYGSEVVGILERMVAEVNGIGKI